jgi:predicted transcriptional regulator
MNTQISTKLAALAIALMMNSLLIGGVAYLFNGPMHQHTAVLSLAHAAAMTVTDRV